MSWLKTAVREVFGLFVDDGRYAFAILVWLGLAWLVLPRLPALGTWSGVLLFAGLAATLAASTMLKARR